MAYSVLHFLDEFPAETMKPGDVYATNDPWRGTGHLYDIVIVTPCLQGDRLVALFACTSHVVEHHGPGKHAQSHGGRRRALKPMSSREPIEPPDQSRWPCRSQ